MKAKYLKVDLEKLQNFIDLLLYPIKFFFIIQYKLTKKPFTSGYNFYKWKIIEKYLTKQKVNIFHNTDGLDERIVEYYWIINELKKLKGKLLDAGSTLNFSIILNKIAKKYDITIQTLYPENDCFFNHGISYVYNDLTQKNFNNNYFDVITCISTLEHIGFDNKIYQTTLKNEMKKNNESYLQVIKNFKLLLKKNGTLLLTIPFGKHQKFEDLQQFDKKMVNKIVKVFKPKKLSKKFAIYEKNRWKFCKEKQCLNIKFKHKSQNHSFDNAASARSIILMKLVK